MAQRVASGACPEIKLVFHSMTGRFAPFGYCNPDDCPLVLRVQFSNLVTKYPCVSLDTA